jgi:hypothetical protein
VSAQAAYRSLLDGIDLLAEPVRQALICQLLAFRSMNFGEMPCTTR